MPRFDEKEKSHMSNPIHNGTRMKAKHVWIKNRSIRSFETVVRRGGYLNFTPTRTTHNHSLGGVEPVTSLKMQSGFEKVRSILL